MGRKVGVRKRAPFGAVYKGVENPLGAVAEIDRGW